MTVKDFSSIVILTCMAVLFASSIVQPTFSCFTCARGTGSPGHPYGAGGLGVGRKNDGEAADSPAEPKGEAREGRLYNGGGEEDSHAGQDNNEAKVCDSLCGPQLPYQLLLFHIHSKTEKYNKSMLKKY